MKLDNMTMTRRVFLRNLLLLTGGAFAASGCEHQQDQADRPDARAVAEELGKMLEFRNLAMEIGSTFILTDHSMQELPLRVHVDQLLESIGTRLDDLTFESLPQLKEPFSDRVRKDFIDEDIVSVDGWVLSQTEARLCAVLYVRNHMRA